MKRRVRQILTFTMMVILTGSAVGLTSSAQEIEGSQFGETEDIEASGTSETETEKTGTVIKVTGTKSTLDCTESIRNMSWDFFCEGMGGADWIEHMDFPDYAVELYKTLVEGANNDEEQDILIENNAFSEETAVKIEYTNGKEDVFNGIEVLEVDTTTKMTEEEWQSIQENIGNVYNVFRLDSPEVFWLNDTPKVSRVCTVRGDEEGTEIYEYKVYFLLKNHNRSYDIRNEAYQSAEVIREGIERREQSIRQVFDGAKEMRPAEMVEYFNKELDIVVNGIGLESNDAACALKMLCDYAGVPCVLVSGVGGILDGYVKVKGTWCMASEVQTILKKSEEDKADKKMNQESDKESDKESDTGTETDAETDKVYAVCPALRSMKTAALSEIMRAGLIGRLKTNAYFERKQTEGNIEFYERIEELEDLIPINSKPYYYAKWGEVVPLDKIDFSNLYIHVKDAGSPDADRRYPVDRELIGLLGASADTRIINEVQSTCDFIIVYNLWTDTTGVDYGCYNMFSGNVVIQPRVFQDEEGNS